MPKKYRLLKDVENPSFRVARGAILEERGEHYQWDNWYVLAKHHVEENKVWFEEIKEKERIEVLSVTFTDTDEYDCRAAWLKVVLSKHISNDHIKPIRKAIESILNDEPIEEQPCMFDEEKINQRLKELRELEVTCKPQTCYVNGIEYVPRPLDFQPLSGELITKEECERREAKAFRFGRKKRTSWLSEDGYMYENYQDYKKHNQ